jgi:hypothetical protein
MATAKTLVFGGLGGDTDDQTVVDLTPNDRHGITVRVLTLSGQFRMIPLSLHWSSPRQLVISYMPLSDGDYIDERFRATSAAGIYVVVHGISNY